MHGGLRVATAAALLLGAGPLAALAGGGVGDGLAAQELARRVADGDGTMTFRVGLRDSVEVCEDGVISGERHRWGRWDGDMGSCSTGVAEVVLHVRNREVRSLELEPWEGPGSSSSHGMDLGEPAPSEAAGFLMGLALDRGPALATRKAAEHGMMTATLLRDVEVWPDLLAVARDRDVERDLRRSALFWVAQVAEARVTDGILEVAGDDSEEQEVRDAAVFALSQRPAEEAVTSLMDLARTAPHAKTRRSALFWLSQIDDPRVVDFFEEILLGG